MLNVFCSYQAADFKRGVIPQFADLNARGLIEHDKQPSGDSAPVFLTHSAHILTAFSFQRMPLASVPNPLSLPKAKHFNFIMCFLYICGKKVYCAHRKEGGR